MFKVLADLSAARADLWKRHGIETKKLRHKLNGRTAYKLEWKNGDSKIVTDYGLLDFANWY